MSLYLSSGCLSTPVFVRLHYDFNMLLLLCHEAIIVVTGGQCCLYHEEIRDARKLSREDALDIIKDKDNIPRELSIKRPCLGNAEIILVSDEQWGDIWNYIVSVEVPIEATIRRSYFGMLKQAKKWLPEEKLTWSRLIALPLKQIQLKSDQLEKVEELKKVEEVKKENKISSIPFPGLSLKSMGG